MAKRKLESATGMHPSNPYFNNPPDFASLADLYPSLRPYVIVKTFRENKAGGSEELPRGSINFRDPEALRELTYCLLKKDFSIDLEIPLDSLCPTIPNRMNYICWIEDLLRNDSNRTVTGIDIGTGASCIYPLLGCVRNKNWRMIGTDIYDRSISYANKNVDRNNLQSAITILKNPSDKILPNALFDDPSTSYVFCMCNPPFYEDEQDIQESADAKDDRPSALCLGTSNEMITAGGDAQFVMKLMNESLELKTKIQWYTSMLGKRSSVDKVVEHLKNYKILNYTLTTFHQGRTNRWAVAWSFGDERAPWASMQQTSTKLAKLAAPKTKLSFESPGISVEMAVERIHSLLEQLSVKHSSPKVRSVISAEVSRNTWSRAARRAIVRAAKESQGGDSSSSGNVEAPVILAVEIRISEGTNSKASATSSSSSPSSSALGATSAIEMTWTLGQDRDLFESFFLHLRTKFAGDKKLP